MTRRERLASRVRPLLEACGVPWLSWPGLNGLDRKLAALLPGRNGWFVEAGANDGFRQSNTYHLARFRGWRGVLIEPVPWLADACRACRPESQVVSCALGSPAQAGGTVTLRYSGLMTSVSGVFGGGEEESRRVREGLRIQGLPAEDVGVEAPVRTLTEVLDTCHAPREFDLLSLDVEGYELAVLAGLDFEKHQPRAMCIEVADANRDAVAALLSCRYEMTAVLHHQNSLGDYFWVRRAG